MLPWDDQSSTFKTSMARAPIDTEGDRQDTKEAR
jgi:hypothetical protein